MGLRRLDRLAVRSEPRGACRLGASAVFSLLLALGSAGRLGAETLTFLTINVWSGLDYRGYLRMGEYEPRSVRAKRTQCLVRQLRALQPDVIAVNEANMLPGYIRSLSRALGYESLWHVGLGGLRAGPVGLPINLREGDAILARPSLALESAGRRQLSGGPVGNFFAAHLADATQVVAGRIRVGGRPVYVFCTHWHASPFPTASYRAELDGRRAAGLLDPNDAERLWGEALDGERWRLEEARGTIEFVERVAGGEAVVLLGDLNALPDSQQVALLRGAGFVDAFAAVGKGDGATWDEVGNPNIGLQRLTHPEDIPDDPPRKRIDYVFVRGVGLAVRRAQVVLDQGADGLYPSDHYGVLAEIELR